MKMEGRISRVKQFIQIFAQPKAIIFCVALAQFISMVVYVVRYGIEFPLSTEGWNPIRIMWEPSLVLFASLMLLIGGTWKYLLAFVSGACVIYQLGYLGLVSVSAAFDLSLLSGETWRRYMSMIYIGQPQYFVQITVSAVIMIYAAALLTSRTTQKTLKQRI